MSLLRVWHRKFGVSIRHVPVVSLLALASAPAGHSEPVPDYRKMSAMELKDYIAVMLAGDGFAETCSVRVVRQAEYLNDYVVEIVYCGAPCAAMLDVRRQQLEPAGITLQGRAGACENTRRYRPGEVPAEDARSGNQDLLHEIDGEAPSNDSHPPPA